MPVGSDLLYKDVPLGPLPIQAAFAASERSLFSLPRIPWAEQRDLGAISPI